jgi:hypothetical protein
LRTMKINLMSFFTYYNYDNNSSKKLSMDIKTFK